MEDFRDYVENQEFDKELNEDAATILMAILGFAAIGFATAFGGTLVIAGGVKAVKFLVKWWKRIIKEIKDINKTPNEIVRDLKQDALVRREKVRMNLTINKYEEDLKDVISAIKQRDVKQARDEFHALEPRLKDLPDVRKTIITEITKAYDEPPLYVVSPGNETYRSIRIILGIRVARAAAEVTKLAIEKQGK